MALYLAWLILFLLYPLSLGLFHLLLDSCLLFLPLLLVPLSYRPLLCLQPRQATLQQPLLYHLLMKLPHCPLLDLQLVLAPVIEEQSGQCLEAVVVRHLREQHTVRLFHEGLDTLVVGVHSNRSDKVLLNFQEVVLLH